MKYSNYATLEPLGQDICKNTDLSTHKLLNPDGYVEKSLISQKLNTMATKNDWIETETNFVQDYLSGLCERIYTKDKTTVILRMEGPTFTTMKRSLRVSFTDKLGSIGGTLGLFSGFSLLAIMEFIHWICKIANSVFARHREMKKSLL